MLEKKINTNEIRKLILKLVIESKEGHIASSFSIVEMLVSIFIDMKKIIGKYKPDNFILSKGHASFAYYAMLGSLKLMSKKELARVGKYKSKFYGHPPFIDQDKRFLYGSGSLGHGLPFALGMSTANALLSKDEWIYCLVGDGEANEGTFWETLLLTQKFKKSKLKILIDCNGSSERAIPILNILNNLKKVFKNISILSCDGHSISSLLKTMSRGKNIRIILCNTIKGYPSTTMRNDPKWHHKIPNKLESKIILQELKIKYLK
jgi:transketolase